MIILFFGVGLVKDDKTLRELHVTSGAKMMVVGSTLGDVITVQAPTPGELKEEPKAEGRWVCPLGMILPFVTSAG